MKVIFSASTTIPGFLIRLGTKSNWCHVDMLFADGTLIGSRGQTGVEKTTLEKRLARPDISHYRVDEIILPDEDSARTFAEVQVGKPYDYTAIFAFLMPWRSNWQEDSKWFCSELVAAAIHQGGIEIARMDASRVTPAFLDDSPLLKTINPSSDPKYVYKQ